jgi:hypothetical protein
MHRASHHPGRVIMHAWLYGRPAALPMESADAAPALVLMLFVALALPSAALADNVPCADDGALPWASGAETSPLEALAGRIASTISGREVTARCEGDYDWGLLAAQHGFDPSAELGYVPF